MFLNERGLRGEFLLPDTQYGFIINYLSFALSGQRNYLYN